MSAANFFDDVAEEGSDDGSDNGSDVGRRNKKDRFEDSSEEEDDDDDDEARREVEEGFIDDDEEDGDEVRQRKKERRKRRREERDEDEGLDEDDLDLIGERPAGSREKNGLKRLKRRHRTEEPDKPSGGLRNIFDEMDEEDDDDGALREYASRNALAHEFDDFIEQDEDGEDGADDEDIRVGPRKSAFDTLQGLESQLDEATVEDLRAVFGDGDEYDWAIDAQEDDEIDRANQQAVELKDIFDPAQLKEMMLTEEDDRIRSTDIPERLQIARGRFLDEELSPEEQAQRISDEADWISTLMWPQKRSEIFTPELLEPFKRVVRQVLTFFNVDNLEAPFISQHRKDYLIHSVEIPDPSGQETTITHAAKMLTQSELWEVLELDLKFRGLLERKRAQWKTYEIVKESTGKPDEIIEELLKAPVNPDEIQDLHDYMYFQYAAQLKDNNTRDGPDGRKAARTPTTVFERVQSSPAYSVVRGFGVDPEKLAQSAFDGGRGGFTEDPEDRPDDMADKFTDERNFPTGSVVLRVAKATFAEQLSCSPRMRKLLRQAYYMTGRIDCVRTTKGMQEISKTDKEWEFKYLRNQQIASFGQRPELFLRMLDAEQRGLVEVRIRLEDKDRLRRDLRQRLESDNLSDAASDWNVLRREALDVALEKLGRVMVKGVKETLKDTCENKLARKCRNEFSTRLDQAPYRPKGDSKGGRSRVFVLTNGAGRDRDGTLIHWAMVDPGTGMIDHGQFTDLRSANQDRGIPAGADVDSFVNVVDKYGPDLIGISGFSPDTANLHKDLTNIINDRDLVINFEDADGNSQQERHPVLYLNDETARHYYLSDLARQEHPALEPMTRYCIGIARYAHGPLKEYAILGSAVSEVKFDTYQDLIPKSKLLAYLETALVDITNIVGVDLLEAMEDFRTASLLPFICGLGKRKADALMKAVRRTKAEGKLKMRSDLVGDADRGITPAVGAQVYFNCASFLHLPFDHMETDTNYLDSTRIHPEDYDLASKMTADALDLDEEDVAAEKNEGGEWAVLRMLVREEKQDKVNDLLLDMYGEQLESGFGQRKRAMLNVIREELVDPLEELRADFILMNEDDVFAMLTGETPETLSDGMNVPAKIKKSFADHVLLTLGCGVEGTVSETDFPSWVGPGKREPRDAFSPHQPVVARVLHLNRKQFTAQLTMREEMLSRPTRAEMDRDPDEWDEAQEERDQRDLQKQEEKVEQRIQRFIKHPLFQSCNSKQAEEFLSTQPVGALVIRPSSKGPDHLTVTWKVAQTVYQHIDVMELDKDNDYALGKTLKIGNYSYSDLDELIANHVMAMAKKVQEIKADDRYNDGTKQQAGTCLEFVVLNCVTNTRNRGLAEQLHGGQPAAVHVRLLPQQQVPRLLPPLLQGQRQGGHCDVAGQGDSECV